jgi:hypothetical protein
LKKLFAILVLTASPLVAQNIDELSFQQAFLLRNISGTSFNPGPEPHQGNLFTRGAWSGFFDGQAFATYVSQSGPEEQENEAFSTNWAAAGVQRSLGSRGLVMFRGRVSLEPLTIKEEGYPQLLQYISDESGEPRLDRMRAHDLIGEVAMQLAFRVGSSQYLHVYAAPVGDPALGAVPFAQRASAREFAEAPFSYDIAEPSHDSTSVVTVGWGSTFASVEASVFHDAITEGRHTSIDGGDIDSRSVRLTLTPTRNVSLQISRGELGDAELEMSTASVSYGTHNLAATLLFSRREVIQGVDFDSIAFETTFQSTRNTAMLRIEHVDRLRNLFSGTPSTVILPEETTHYTVGYMFDFISNESYRTGAGINIDYHTQTHDLEHIYGHKPQSIYLFVRARTE